VGKTRHAEGGAEGVRLLLCLLFLYSQVVIAAFSCESPFSASRLVQEVLPIIIILGRYSLCLCVCISASQADCMQREQCGGAGGGDEIYVYQMCYCECCMTCGLHLFQEARLCVFLAAFYWLTMTS
jgi:hypothetical protein